MNTYELEIHFDDNGYAIREPVHRHIECDESSLEDYLGMIANRGVLIGDEYNGEFIPGRRILYIEVKFLEKIQRNVEM